MRWTDARLVSALALVIATSAHATSGVLVRTRTCLHPARPGKVFQVDRAKPPISPEQVIVGLIGAGTTAWNATLGGIMPAPELVLKPVTRRV